ncbi:hypothetical protein CAP47_07065 [Psychroflexus sp. S27]|uniref:YARHG domain-containing protein n=1 Tax=Psychroflexus sp. S27 TaxID=1982757 RepID=UPI000C2A349D|nr:YARHG domain-containing protein [Psychroflexus sp. S27]PJX22779.1 hypothetical protein CAP47_07065 [Psychroflexus sp. S27]
MTRKILLLVLLIFTSIKINAQCDYITNRLNGVTVKQFEPSLVAYDSNYQIGIALGKVENDITLTVLVRFSGNAKLINSNLLIFTDEENAVNLEYDDSQKDYMAGSEISLTKFKINPNQYDDLLHKSLKTFRFKFANEDIYRTFEVVRNLDVISNQLKCFNKNNLIIESKKNRKKKSNTIIIYELDDLIKLDVDELRIKRNEVYARRGRIFKSKYLQEYFSKTDWYEPRFENVENLLSKRDRDNISKVKRVENTVKFQNIEEAKLKFKLPNIHWRFTERKTHKDKIIYTYKRDVILDSAGREIDPQITFIIEPVGSNADVIQYSIVKRMATPFDLVDMFTHEDGYMKFKNGVGYQGKYFDRGLEHRIYIVHGINNKMGITLVMDTTEEVSDIVAPEFQKCLSTLDIKK